MSPFAVAVSFAAGCGHSGLLGHDRCQPRGPRIPLARVRAAVDEAKEFPRAAAKPRGGAGIPRDSFAIVLLRVGNQLALATSHAVHNRVACHRCGRPSGSALDPRAALDVPCGDPAGARLAGAATPRLCRAGGPVTPTVAAILARLHAAESEFRQDVAD